MDTNIEKYLAFIRAVECGSFTRAAEALSYTQSSVSKMIAPLERDMGMTLLEKGAKAEISELFEKTA